MNSLDIIREIRLIVKEGRSNYNMDSFLKRHQCEFLCVSDESYKVKYQENLETVSERFLACKRLFDKINMPYAVFKGAVLSKQLYQDPFVRRSGDIDILFSMDNYHELKEVLKAEGFLQGSMGDGEFVPVSRRKSIFQISSSHQVPSYIKRLNSEEKAWVTLDLNHNLMWGENSKKMNMSLVLKQTQNDEIMGVSFKKLTAEMEFIALCMHHYKDMNSLFQLIKGHYRLVLFWEIYKYLITVKPDTKKIQKLCKQFEVGEYVYYCVYYAQSIFESEELDGYLSAFIGFKKEEIMNTYGLSDDERKTWGMPFEDRLICEVLPLFVYNHLTEKERNKIDADIQYI